MSISEISFQAAEPPPVRIHRFTVEAYHQLGEIGVITPEDRVELLEGWIVEKMNQRPAHGFVVRKLDNWFQSKMPAGWLVQCQLPVTLKESEPEPDVAILRGVHAHFSHRHPGGADCRLVIEVADSSLAKDRAKGAIYAAAEIGEYWIINLNDKTLERMTMPVRSGYSQVSTLKSGEMAEIQIGDNLLTLSLSDLFDGI